MRRMFIGTLLIFLGISGLICPPAVASDTLVQTIASQGIFEWFQKPAAVRFAGTRDRTYVGWIAHSGEVHLRVRDNKTGTWRRTVALVDLSERYGHAAVDDHNAPSLLMLPNGTLLVFSSVHDTHDALGVQRMVKAENEFHWTPWKRVFTGTGQEYDYPQAKRLSSGRIILFYRIGKSADAMQAYSVSDDDGRTWSRPTILVNFGRRIGIYAFIHQRGDELHMVWNQRHPGNTPRHLFYAVSRDGGEIWTTSDGAPLSLPITRATAEPILISRESLYGWDILTTGGGEPVVAFVRGDGSRHRYSLARLGADGWTVEDITSSRELYGKTHFYAGGIVIDPRSSRRVLISKQRGDAKELEAWVRVGAGRWKRQRVITRDSGRDNFRPQFVRNDPSGRIVWSSGFYDGNRNREWDGFDRVDIQTATLR